MNRRDILKALPAAALPLPVWVRADDKPDVVVVGAGAAGLAAAEALLHSGLSVVVLEADSRIGGRAFTETTTFGFPYDRGCHWLHHASTNPWRSYAEHNGFDVRRDDGEAFLFANGRAQSPRQLREFNRAMQEAFELTREASRGQEDAPLSRYLRGRGAWSDVIESVIVHDWYGHELADLSTDYFMLDEDDDDWICAQGFGRLISHFGRNLPVRLGVEVKEIRWGGSGVQVETSVGSLRSRAVIVTASTGVLAAGGIGFSPLLPPEKTESFHAFPMGAYNHIALLYSEDVFQLGRNAYVIPRVAGEVAPGLLSNMDGTGLVMIYVGGDLCRDLQKEGVRAAISYGTNYIDRLVGGDSQSWFSHGDFTRWDIHPWSLGSYPAARPGGLAYRDNLRAPIGDRVFFAGDACHRDSSADAARAYESGRETAGHVIDALG